MANAVNRKKEKEDAFKLIEVFFPKTKPSKNHKPKKSGYDWLFGD